MYVDDTSILNVGENVEELETFVSINTNKAIHYFEQTTHIVI